MCALRASSYTFVVVFLQLKNLQGLGSKLVCFIKFWVKMIVNIQKYVKNTLREVGHKSLKTISLQTLRVPPTKAKINSWAGLGGIHLTPTLRRSDFMAVSAPYWEELIIDGLAGDLSAMLANKPNQWLCSNSQSLDTGHHPSPSNFRCDLFVALVIGPGASCNPCQGLHLWAGSRVLSNFKL